MTAEIYQFPKKKRRRSRGKRKAKQNVVPMWLKAVRRIRIALLWGIAGAALLTLMKVQYEVGFEDGRVHQRALDCQWSGGTMENGVCWVSKKAGQK